MAKTVVGSFDSYAEAQQVLSELQSLGISSGDVNLVANDARGEYASGASTTTSNAASSVAADVGKGAVTGGLIGGTAGLVAALVGVTIPGIGPIVAAGPIAAALTGAGVGAVAGGLVGGLTHVGVPDTHASYYAESVRRGGALLVVRADESRADDVAALMRRHGAHDIDERVSQWKTGGWTGYDPNAAPYTVDEIDRERTRYGSRSVDRPGLGDDMHRAGDAMRRGAARASDAIERAVPGDSDRDGK